MAVEAGLGLTVCTRQLLALQLDELGTKQGQPPLPSVAFALYGADGSSPWPARDDLVDLCRHAFQA